MQVKRWKKLAALFVHKEQLAYQEYSQLKQQLNAEKAKLAHLQQYQLDYQNQALSTFKQGVLVGQIKAHHGFLSKIEQACEQQQQQIHIVSHQLEPCEQRWRECQKTAEKIKHMADWQADKLAKHIDKQEKQQLDEWTVTRHTQNHTDGL